MILFGVDMLLQQAAHFKGRRLALVTNSAATTSTGILSRVALLQAGFTLSRLFSPEHGLAATGADGSFQAHGTDPATGLPVISLYGDRLAPTAADLEGIDLVLFDVPDVGCRFYTYLWTLTHVMEACAQHHVPLLVLDRPNPHGEDTALAEGPGLDEAHCSSFIGRWNIPLKHNRTLGQLARHFAATRVPGLQLEVVSCAGVPTDYNGYDYLFVPPSPAITTVETALVYPGMGLLEGLNVNEGRGTPRPFLQCGAPWLQPGPVLAQLHPLALTGIDVEPTAYTPASGLYAGEPCTGLQWRLNGQTGFMAVQTGLALLRAIISTHPTLAAERLYPTVANPAGKGHLDRLLGVRGSWGLLRE